MVLSALALLISSLVESAAMAYVITLSVYFSFLALRSFPFLEWLYPYLFVTDMLRWQQCISSYVKTGEIYVSLDHLAGYLIAFLAAAVLLFEQIFTTETHRRRSRRQGNEADIFDFRFSILD
jgi:hypothetical protein